jgi:cytoskeletal protein RodZ
VTAPTGPGPSPGGGGARTGATSARGIALLVGAVVLGIALLRATDPPDSLADASEGPERTASTAPSTTEEPDESTTSSSSSSSTTEAAPEGEPLVLVANGAANTVGVAGRLSVTVEDGGFAIAPPANATADVETSTVYFAPGFEEAAAEVAALFDPAPATAPMPDPLPVSAGDLQGATVILVAGPDIAG